MRKNLILISTAVFFLIVAIAIAIYVYFNGRSGNKNVENTLRESKLEKVSPKDGVGYQETKTAIRIGTEGTYSGQYSKVENGNIYFEGEGTLKELPLNSDEIVIQCTNQDLNNIENIDFSKVLKVEITKPELLGSMISEGEAIVIFVSGNGSNLQAHTIVRNISVCTN